jgi:serine/threonine-protein kinase
LDLPVAQLAAERGPLAAGTLLGNRFRVERLVGRGGMGDVYAARHATTGKEVALKVLRSADRSWRFTREARAATAIKHPNVVEVYDLFEEADGTPVMVMELLEGETFGAYRTTRGALTLQEASQIFVPVLRAVRAAHAKGIVHRDLKPDNIFLARSEAGPVPKILDFGIAKMLDPLKVGSGTQSHETNTAAIVGTPHYMSYEQAMSEEIDGRTDIWSIGVILFETLTGRRPIVFDKLGQMFAAFLQGTVPAIRDLVPDLPVDAAGVIDRCLAKKKEDRLDDLAPLIDVLAKYADGRAEGASAGGRVLGESIAALQLTPGPTSRPVARPGRKRSRVVLAAAVVAAVAGAATMTMWAQHGTDGSSGRPPEGFSRIAAGPPEGQGPQRTTAALAKPTASGSDSDKTADASGVVQAEAAPDAALDAHLTVSAPPIPNRERPPSTGGAVVPVLRTQTGPDASPGRAVKGGLAETDPYGVDAH